MSSPVTWRKSSHSGGTSGTDCVELARFPDTIGIRDSKNPTGGNLNISANAAKRLFAAIRQDKYTL